MTSASALVPLWNRSAEWTRRLAMINSARSFLYLTTFYIEHDAYGTALLAALQHAQRRGVSVTLLIDSFGQRMGGVLMTAAQRAALTRELDALREAGGTVVMYAPPYLAQRLLGGGQHVKIQVSEVGEAIFGSGNITLSSFEHWNEYAVAVSGPVVGALLESVRSLGGSVDPAHLEQLARTATHTPADVQLDYWLCNPNALQGRRGPVRWRGRNEVTDRMIAMLDTARHSALITSFYFKPVEALNQAVLRAARRGVQVEIFHSHRDALPATDLAWIAAAANYNRLLDAGVRVYENLHGEHSKLVVIDETWAAFGSYNFEDAAHDRLAEAMLASHDPRAIAPLRAIFAELRSHPDNLRVTHDSMRQLPRRVQTRVARYGRFKWWM
jgi:cardiolipin synthase